MNINATLIVQACNFFFAYVVLRLLFFKPLTMVIRQDQMQLDGLINQLTEKRKLLLSIEASRKEQWQQMQKEFGEHIPDVTHSDLYIFKGLSSERQRTMFSKSTIKQFEQELVPVIVKKVDHVGS